MRRLGRSTAANLVPPGSLPRKQEGGFEDRQIAPAQKVGARSTGEPGFLNQKTKGAALKADGQGQLRKLQTSHPGRKPGSSSPAEAGGLESRRVAPAQNAGSAHRT